MRDRTDLDDTAGPAAVDRAAGPDAGPAPRGGPQIGPVRVTPTRVTLVIALVGGLAFLAWATFVRDQLQVPLMASGLAILALVFGSIAVLSVGAVVRAGREGRDGPAVLTALAGGLIAVGAMLCLAGAVIMWMIWRTTG
jgi:drug/metabolite transporter (DMT)-like permease